MRALGINFIIHCTYLSSYLKVEVNSPADLAGLMPEKDYLLGTAEKVNYMWPFVWLFVYSLENCCVIFIWMVWVMSCMSWSEWEGMIGRGGGGGVTYTRMTTSPCWCSLPPDGMALVHSYHDTKGSAVMLRYKEIKLDGVEPSLIRIWQHITPSHTIPLHLPQVFRDTDVLYEELAANLETPVEFYVYNSDSDEVNPNSFLVLSYLHTCNQSFDFVLYVLL